MGLRDTIRSNAAPLLAAGEEIQAVVPAQFSPPAARSLVPPQRVTLVATNQRLLLCKSGRWRITPITELLGEMPRDTQIGPFHGIWYRFDGGPGGIPLYIHRRFHKDVEAADDARAGVPAAW